MKKHHYQTIIQWTGNTGEGTLNYKSYERDYEILSPGKPVIPASSDPAFRGVKDRYNPEEQLVSALSGCHMLWYLHLCSVAGIVVTNYVDRAEGTMIETENGSGAFQSVTLKPTVTVQQKTMVPKAERLHAQASKMCFIANSVNFAIFHEGIVVVGGTV